MKTLTIVISWAFLISACSNQLYDSKVIDVVQSETQPKEEFTITVLESPSKEVPVPTPSQAATTPTPASPDVVVDLPQVSQPTPPPVLPKAVTDDSQKKLLESLKKENEKLLTLLAEKEGRKKQSESIQKLKEPSPKEGKSYFVMVGSFKSVSAYEKLTSKIRSDNLPVVTTQKVVGEDTIRSVKVGPFESKDQAALALQKLLEDSSFPKDAFVK